MAKTKTYHIVVKATVVTTVPIKATSGSRAIGKLALALQGKRGRLWDDVQANLTESVHADEQPFKELEIAPQLTDGEEE